MKKIYFTLNESNAIFIKLAFVSLFILIITSVYCQEPMTPKEGFYYLLKTKHEGVKENAIEESNHPDQFMSWFDLYVNLFDKKNYEYYRQNEFKWPAYSKIIHNKIHNGINSSDFKKTFSYWGNVSLGIYDFKRGGFPIKTYTGTVIFMDDLTSSKIILNTSIWKNVSDIDFFLKMDSQKAEKLVESIGTDREVKAQVIYNVVDKNIQNSNNWNKLFLGMGIYVHKIIFHDKSGVLGEILPEPDYCDKVNLVKIENGKEKIFYDVNWNVLNRKDSVDAKYYGIRSYKDCQYSGVQTDYYMNGKKQMEGHYSRYGEYKEGLFIWYYENGQKQEEVAFRDGSMNGVYTSWYKNGQIKEKVNYINGLKDGCDYKWESTGDCAKYTGDLGDYYKNGQVAYMSTKCPCSKNVTQARNTTTDRKKSTVEGLYVGYFNYDLPTGNYKLYDKNVYYKAKGLKISALAVEDIDRNPINNSRIKLGQPLFLKLKIRRLNGKTGTFKYILSNHVADSQGTVYSSESVARKIENESSWITIPGGIRRMPDNSSSKETYMSFEIKAINSDAIIQGYIKFLVYR